MRCTLTDPTKQQIYQLSNEQVNKLTSKQGFPSYQSAWLCYWQTRAYVCEIFRQIVFPVSFLCSCFWSWPQPFCHQHHHYLHHVAVVVIVIFVPIVSILFYNHHFHYLICFWVVKQRNSKEAGTCTFVVNLNDQLSWFSFLFYVSTLNSPQKLRSSHWWLSTSMWWVLLFFECTSYHSTSRCQILQENRRIYWRMKRSIIW